MKKTLIAITVICSIIVLIIGALVAVELRSKAELQAKVSDFLGECDIYPLSVDVHGRPYMLYGAQGRADLTYVDLSPADGANKDQLLVHRLTDAGADRLTRFITVDYPSPDAQPVLGEDGAYTDTATIGGKHVSFSATATSDGIRVFADSEPTATLAVPADVTVKGVSAGDDGVIVEVEYVSPSCG